MQLTLHATRRTPQGASRLVQAISAWSVRTRHAPSRHCRDARVYGQTTTVMNEIEYISPVEYTTPLPARIYVFLWNRTPRGVLRRRGVTFPTDKQKQTPGRRVPGVLVSFFCSGHPQNTHTLTHTLPRASRAGTCDAEPEHLREGIQEIEDGRLGGKACAVRRRGVNPPCDIDNNGSSNENDNKSNSNSDNNNKNAAGTHASDSCELLVGRSKQ